jgi:hypothetical protein
MHLCLSVDDSAFSRCFALLLPRDHEASDHTDPRRYQGFQDRVLLRAQELTGPSRRQAEDNASLLGSMSQSQRQYQDASRDYRSGCISSSATDSQAINSRSRAPPRPPPRA